MSTDAHEMPDQEQPKRKGRPPKYAGEGKRQNFSFRIRDKIREQLVATVQESGRSLSEEIEWRIERSFEQPKLVQEVIDFTLQSLFGSQATREFAQRVAQAVMNVERFTQKEWTSDPVTQWESKIAVEEVISQTFDIGEPPPAEDYRSPDGKRFERHVIGKISGQTALTGTLGTVRAAGLTAPTTSTVPAEAAATAPISNDLEATIKRAVIAALRETLPTSLTNRPATSEPREPPKVTPPAPPAEQAAWAPVAGETPNPDEPAQDGQPAKGGRKKPPAE